MRSNKCPSSSDWKCGFCASMSQTSIITAERLSLMFTKATLSLLNCYDNIHSTVIHPEVEKFTLSFNKISYVVTSTLNFNFLFPGWHHSSARIWTQTKIIQNCPKIISQQQHLGFKLRNINIHGNKIFTSICNIYKIHISIDLQGRDFSGASSAEGQSVAD